MHEAADVVLGWAPARLGRGVSEGSLHLGRRRPVDGLHRQHLHEERAPWLGHLRHRLALQAGEALAQHECLGRVTGGEERVPHGELIEHEAETKDVSGGGRLVRQLLRCDGEGLGAGRPCLGGLGRRGEPGVRQQQPTVDAQECVGGAHVAVHDGLGSLVERRQERGEAANDRQALAGRDEALLLAQGGHHLTQGFGLDERLHQPQLLPRRSHLEHVDETGNPSAGEVRPGPSRAVREGGAQPLHHHRLVAGHLHTNEALRSTGSGAQSARDSVGTHRGDAAPLNMEFSVHSV